MNLPKFLRIGLPLLVLAALVFAGCSEAPQPVDTNRVNDAQIVYEFPSNLNPGAAQILERTIDVTEKIKLHVNPALGKKGYFRVLSGTLTPKAIDLGKNAAAQPQPSPHTTATPVPSLSPLEKRNSAPRMFSDISAEVDAKEFAPQEGEQGLRISPYSAGSIVHFPKILHADHLLQLRYTVSRGVQFFADHQEFSADFGGQIFGLPTQRAGALIVLPNILSANQVTVKVEFHSARLKDPIVEGSELDERVTVTRDSKNTPNRIVIQSQKPMSEFEFIRFTLQWPGEIIHPGFFHHEVNGQLVEELEDP